MFIEIKKTAYNANEIMFIQMAEMGSGKHKRFVIELHMSNKEEHDIFFDNDEEEFNRARSRLIELLEIKAV